MALFETILLTGFPGFIAGKLLGRLAWPLFPHFTALYTSVATELLARHGISCPSFSSYVGNLLDFVKKNPSL